MFTAKRQPGQPDQENTGYLLSADVMANCLRLFRQPVKDELTISLDQTSIGETDYRMTDVSGKTIKRGTLNWNRFEYTLPLKALALGVYLLNIQFGTAIKSVKMIKE